jgi:hypothetical protein
MISIFWFFSTMFVWNIFHSKNKWARYDQKCTSMLLFYVTYPLFLRDFDEIQIFFNRFSKNPPIRNFIKIFPVQAEFFNGDRRADGLTDGHDEANSSFLRCRERAL